MTGGWLWLRHPDLPGQVIRVRESGAAMRRAAGWVPAPPPPPPEPEPDETEPDEGEPDRPAPEQATPRRRRKSEKESG